MKKLLWILLFVIPVLSVAQSKLSPYTRLFLEQHKEAKNQEQKVQMLKQFAACSVTEDDEEFVSGFLLLKTGFDTSELEEMGVQINTVLDSIFTVRVPLSQLESVMALGYVKRFEMGTPVFKSMNIARKLMNVDEVHNGGGGLPQGYTGKNTVIGIVDGGFQYDHINFYTKDRKNFRVKAVWDQDAGVIRADQRPQGYNYGHEYKTKEEILAAKHDKLEETHGTHVAGIAAGSTTYKNAGGVAPDADIVLVSTNMTSDALLDGVKYCFTKAGGKPCVVNLSLGSHVGPHDGTLLFDRACDVLLGEKRILVGSAGNEGNEAIHVSKYFDTSNSTMKSIFNVEDKRAVVDIWGDVGQNYSVQLSVIDINTMTEKCLSKVVSPATGSETYKITEGGSGTFRFATEWNSTNDKGNILVTVDANLNQGCCLVLAIESNEEGTVNAWLNRGLFDAANREGFVSGNSQSTVGEIGGVGNRTISVGSINSATGKISNFSSKGPTADGRIKPDILAPGQVILSSVNGYNISNESDLNNLGGQGLSTESVDGKKYRYGRMQGTSMSSPFMAGIIAVWMENARFMTPEDVKDVLQKTSIQDNATGVVPNNNAGYGKVDALAGLLETFTFSSLEELEASDAQLICYPNPVVDYLKLFFPKSDKNVLISIRNANGQLVAIHQIEKVDNLQETTIDFSAMSPGLYLVSVIGDRTCETFKVQK